MPKAAGIRDDRLQVRVDVETKALLRRAAGYRYRTLSQFVLATALEAAEKVVRENEAVIPSQLDQIFYDALVNPPTPNPAKYKGSTE
jgi:uncharacterized protein (DUF1778 family)